MSTCKGCDWSGLNLSLDDDLLTIHEWLCWRDPGCPSQRMVTRDESKVPPKCADWWCGDA